MIERRIKVSHHEKRLEYLLFGCVNHVWFICFVFDIHLIWNAKADILQSRWDARKYSG